MITKLLSVIAIAGKNKMQSIVVFMMLISVFTLRSQTINVQGNATTIVNGDQAPVAADHTDFGIVNLSSSITRTFTIQNTHLTNDLNLTGAPIVTVTGAVGFVVTTLPATPVAASGSTTFEITFTPTQLGMRRAIVSIANNDPVVGKNPYVFHIQGIGANPSTTSVSCVDFESGVGAWTTGNTTVGSEALNINSSATSFRIINFEHATTSNLDFSPYEFVELSFDYRATAFSSAAQSFSVQYSDNAGTSSYQVLDRKFYTSDFANGNTSTITVRVNAKDFNFKAASSRFRIQCESTNNARYINVDNICVTGFNSANQKINIRGKNLSIANNSITPILGNHTDFNQVYEFSGTRTRTFTIENLGISVLNLTGTPAVSISGTHASDFTVTTQPASSVVGSSSTTFVITFDPSAVGVREALVTIENNDSTQDPFMFLIQGTGVNGVSTSLIACQDFEVNNSPWTLLGAPIRTAYNVDGSTFSFRLTSNNQSLSSPFQDLTNFVSARVSFDFRTEGYTGTEGFLVQFSDDGGTSYTTVSTFTVGTDFQNFVPGKIVVNIPSVSYNFNGVNRRFRIIGNGNAVTDIVYVDNLCVEALVRPSIQVQGNSVNITANDLTPSVLDHTSFGNVVLGSDLTRTYTITNTGAAPLNVTAPTITGLHPTEYAMVTSPDAVVQGGASTTFQVRFTPTSLGEKRALITIATNDSQIPTHTFRIKGTGNNTVSSVLFCQDYENAAINTPWTGGTNTLIPVVNGTTRSYRVRAAQTAVTSLLNLDNFDYVDLSFDFNAQGYAAAQGFRVEFSDNGGTIFTTLGEFLVGTNLTLLRSETQNFRVSAATSNFSGRNNIFRITSIGTTTAHILYVDDVCITGYRESTSTINVVGNGFNILSGSTVPTHLNHTRFGQVDATGASNTRTYTIQNLGEVPLNVGAITITGVSAADFSIDTPPSAVIAPGASSVMVVRFTPSAVGPRTATINIANDQATKNPYSFSVSGTGSIGVPNLLATIANNCETFESATGVIWSGGSRPAFNVSGSPTSYSVSNVAAASTNNIDFSTYSTATIFFDYKALGYTGTEGFRVRFSDNAGASYITLATYQVETDFNLSAQGIISLTVEDTGASPFNLSLGTARFRIESIGDSAGDIVYFDNVCISGIGKQKMVVKGNNTIITNGDRTASSADHTQFGDVTNGSNLIRTFSIENPGGVHFNLTGTPLVSVTGADAASFVVTAVPSTSKIYGQQVTTFQVTFSPVRLGMHQAVISIANDTSVDNPYVFAISGRGVDAATVLLNCEGFEVNSGIWTNSRSNFNINGSTVSLNRNNLQTATTTAFDFTNYEFVEITFDYQALGYAAGEGFAVQFKDHSGLTYFDVAEYVSGVDFTNGVSGTFTVRINARDYIFTGANEQFRIASKGSFSTDIIRIDDVCIHGYVSNTPKINVRGNNYTIKNGDLTPSLVNHTDFGFVYASATSLTRTFTVQNTGNSPLSLTGAPLVSVTGVNASEFVVSTLPSSTVAGINSTTFQITFTPLALGLRTATVTIASNDATNPSYVFAVHGTGVNGALVDVNCEDFETTNGIWNWGGARVAQDINDGSTFSMQRVNQQWVTTNTNLNFTDYTFVSISFDYRNAGYTGTEGFRVRYSSDGLATWTTVGTFTVGADFENGLLGIVNIGIPAAGNDFTTGQARFRIESNGDTNADRLFFDNVCIRGIPKQAIDVKGNGVTIANNDFTPSLTDHTDFGNVNTSTPFVRTFSIDNIGGPTVDLTSAPIVQISGADAGSFVITQPSAAFVFGQQSRTFQVTFTPTRLGAHYAKITIANSTASDNPYVFDIQGRGVNASTVLLNCEDFQVDSGMWSTNRRTAFNINGSSHTYNLFQNNTTTSTNLNLSSYEFVEVTFNYRPQNFTLDEGFSIEFRDNVSTSFVSLRDFTVDTGMINDVNQTVTIRIDSRDFNFNGGNNQIRFTALPVNDNNLDRVYLDNICIHGFNSTTPKINVRGNNNTIDHASTSPSLVNHSDFGYVYTQGAGLVRTFTIRNLGLSALNLTGAPLVNISGVNAGDFVVTVMPTSPVASLGTTTFSVRFIPGALGLRTATISIANNDTTKNPYTFAVRGTGVPGAVVDINCETFESNQGIWSSAGSPDTGNQRLTYDVNGSAIAYRVRNEGFVNTNNQNFSNYGQAIVTFSYRTLGYTGTEGFRIRFSDNGGASYTTIATYTVNTHFVNGAVGIATAIVSSADYDFLSGTSRFRIESVGNSNNDRLHFDDVCVSGVIKSSMQVEGNATLITNNNATPSAAYGTDFGSVTQNTGFVRTFTVRNPSLTTLNLTGTPRVQVSGLNASEFVVTTMPNAFVTALGTSTFQVTFTPTALGLRRATITIANDSGNDNPYVFEVFGRGVNASSSVLNCEDFEVSSGIFNPNRRVAVNVNNSPNSYRIRNAETGTTTNLDLRLYDFVELTFHYRTQGYQDGQGFAVLFSDNGGTSFTEIANYIEGSDFNNGESKTINLRVNASAYRFGGVNNQFRFLGKGTSNRDVYIDDVCVSGYRSSNSKINVKGKGLIIVNGDLIPVLSNHTDFGPAYQIGSGTVTRTFTIENIGNSVLNLTGAPRVTTSGPNAAEFVVTAQPAASLAVLGTTTFNVRFTPTALGVRTATVTILSDDPTRNPYTFTVQGTGVDGIIQNVDGSGNCNTFETGVVPAPTITWTGGTTITSSQVNGVRSYRATTAQILTSAPFNLTNYRIATITFDYRSEGYTGTEGFIVQFSDNNGGTYTTIGSFDVSSNLTNGVKSTISLTVTAGDYLFSNGDERFRIQSLGDAATDLVYIDDVCITGITKSQIVVLGNSATIANNDFTPSTLDHTDFGNVTQPGNLVRTFRINNTGGATLNFTSTPRVQVSGVNASDFVVTTQPSASVPGSNFTTFQVRFTPSAMGVRNALITINSDDDLLPSYVYSVTGKGVNAFTAQLNCEDFESNMGIWTGGARQAVTVNGTANSVRLQSLESTTSNSLNLTPYEFVEISFDFNAQNYLPGQGFAIDFSDDGGITYNTISTGLLNIDFATAVSNTFVSRVNYTDYDLTGNNELFRIRTTGASAARFVNIDKVCITGYISNEPKIVVRGNNLLISNNASIAPSLINHTDFGQTYSGGGTIARTFTVQNIGGVALSLNGTPRVQVSGTHATEFNVTTLPVVSVPGSSAATFVVTFAPQALGVRTATLTIPSNDVNIPNYVYNVQGTGTIGQLADIVCQDFETNIAPWNAPAVRNAYNVNGSPNAMLINGNQNSITDYFDLSNYLTSTITFDYKTEGYTVGQGFRIDFLVGGSSIVVKNLVVDTDFQNTKRNIVSVTVSAADFDFSIPNNNRFRIVTAAGGAGRILNVDNLCISGVLKPSYRIEGNSTPITNNDLTPQTGDHTDFGNVNLGGNFVRTFTVNNTGGPSLNLTGTPRVSVSGVNASEFVVTTLPNALVPGLSTTTFQVTFTPTALGMRNALITIATDNVLVPSYVFAIQGRGANASTTTVNCEDFQATSGIWTGGAIQSFAVNHTTQSYELVSNGFTTSSNLDFNNYEFVELTFDFQVRGYTGGQTFEVLFSENAGTSLYSSVKTFQVSNDFDNTISTTKTVQVFAKDFDFSGANERFIIRSNGNNGSRIVNLDNVCVTGYRRDLPLIAVKANDLKIENNDTTPNLADFTNFGKMYHDGGTIVNTFTIQNVGGLALNLTGTPRVQVTGTHASDFVVTTQPSASIGASGSSNFQITFNPSAIGIRTATVTIASNDTSKSPYTFNINGEGVVGDITTIACQDFDVLATPVAPWITGGTVVPYNVSGLSNTMRLQGGESLRTEVLDFNDYFTSTLTFDFKTEGYTGTQGFRIFRSTNLGFNWLEMDEFDVNVDFVNGVKGRVSVTVNADDHRAFFTAANEMWRIDSQGGATGFIYIDNICITGIRKQIIQVQGNTIPIVNNDKTPSVIDNTDFGDVILGSNTPKTLRVANLGGPTLTLTGIPKVLITGTNASEFVVTTMPADQVFGNTTSPFVITFTPTALGIRTATVTISSDDPKSDPYIFDIQGRGINVSTASVDCQDFEAGVGIWSIGNGVTAPISINGTPRSLTIQNQEFTETTDLDFSAYEYVELSFDFRAQGFTGVQTFDVQYTDNSGTSIPIIQRVFQVDTDFAVNIPRTATVRVYAKDFDFTSNKNRFRIKVNGNSAARVLYIDNVCITGLRRALPLIAVRGNNLPIVNNDVTPSFADHTNFGNVYEGGQTLVRTFTVRNIGGSTLNLNGAPVVAVSGTHATDFVVTTLPSTSLTASTETTFQITFDPSSLGTRNATITIASNSSENAPFVFNISGVGLNNLINQVNCQDFETDATPWLASGVRQAYNVDGSINALGLNSNQTSITDYFDFTTYESVTLSFDYKTEGYTGTEGFRILFFVGGTGTILKTYVVDTDFVNGYKGSASITVNASDFPPFTTNNKRFRIESRGNTTADKLFVDNVCIAGVVREQIEVRGNNIKIANGDTFPLANKHTDFETLNTRQFTIFNTTGSPLNVTSVTLSGVDATRFSVIGAPTTIPANSSATFDVLFNPLVVGAHNATVNIVHGGVNSPYTFAIRGNGIAPTIQVTGNGIDIPTGNTVISGLDNTYFGSVFLTSGRNKTFAISNSGTIALGLTGSGPINFTGGSSSTFTFVTQPATTLAGNASADVVVRYSPTVVGTDNATITIANTVGPNYTFSISGDGKEGSFEVPGCVGTGWLSQCPDPTPINLSVGGTLSNMNVVTVSGVKSLKWQNPGLAAGVNASAIYNATGLESAASSAMIKFTLRTDVNSCVLTGREYKIRVNFAGVNYLDIFKASGSENYSLQYFPTTSLIAASDESLTASKTAGGCLTAAKPTTIYMTIPKSVGVTSGNISFSIRETTQTASELLSQIGLYISNVEVLTDAASCRFVWLKADKGTSATTDGAVVSSWADQSILSNNAVQTTPANQPVYVTNSLNFNPGIDFSGNRNMIGQSGYSSGTQIVVFNRNAATTSGTASMTLIGSRITDSDLDRSGVKLGGFSSSVAGEVYGILRGLSAGSAVGATGISIKNGFITIQPNTTPPTAWLATRNGLSEAPTSGGTGYSQWAARPYVLGSSVTNATYTSFTDYYTGHLLEVINYPTRLSTNELQRVQSYLAIKYGLTLGHNYLKGDGTVLYNVGTHNRRVFGIGRDNCQGLHQRQAKSESDNAVALDDDLHKMITIGYSGVIGTENSSANSNDLPDGTFIMMGDDNAAIATWSATNAPTPALIEAERIERTWKVQTTGVADKTRVRVDGSKLPAISYNAVGNTPKERVALVIATSVADLANAVFSDVATNRIIPLNRVGADWETDVVFNPNSVRYMTIIKYADCYEDLDCSGTETTWNGTWSNGNPSVNKRAIIAANYNTTTHGNFSACKLEINSGVTLTIEGTGVVQVQSDVVNNGVIAVGDGAGLMQYFDQSKNTGTGTITVTRASNPMFAADYTYWSSPVQGFNISSIPKNRAYFRNSVANTWVRYDSGVMNSGQGYIIMTNNTSKTVPTITTVNFTGTMFNGRRNLTLPAGLDKYHLVGNPYPGALSADDFILDNQTRIEGGLYFWTHYTRIDGYFEFTSVRGSFSQSDYAVYTLTGGTRTAPTSSKAVPNSSTTPVVDSSSNVLSFGGANISEPDGYIASGQAFFVGSLDNTVPQTLDFKNCQRTIASGLNSQFFRPSANRSNEKHRFWLDLMNQEGSFKQVLIGYFNGATNGVDNLYDAEALDGTNSVSIYSILNSNTASPLNASIQGRAMPFNIGDKIPLGFRAGSKSKLSNRIYLSKYEGLFNETPIYLHDKFTDVVHDLKASPYDFTSDQGTFEDRFEIVYENKPVDLNEDASLKGVVVSQTPDIINVYSKYANIKSVTVYNTLGQQLYTAKDLDTENLNIMGVMPTSTMVIISMRLANGEKTMNKIIY